MLSGRGLIGQDEKEEEQIPLRTAYLNLAERNSDIVVIDASKSQQVVLEQVKKKISEVFAWKIGN